MNLLIAIVVFDIKERSVIQYQKGRELDKYARQIRPLFTNFIIIRDES